MTRPLTPVQEPFSFDIEVRRGTLERIRQRIHSARTDDRPAISDFTIDADEFQRRVITSEEDTIRMVAPAGSGKTQTIVNRVLHKIRRGTGPSRILLLTFDNSAVTSIRQKLGEQAEAAPEAARAIAEINVSTLNAFGYRILRESFKHEYKRVATDGAPNYIVGAILRDLEKAWPERHAVLPPYLRQAVYLDLFSFLKNELCDPRAIDAPRAAEILIGARQAEPFMELAGDDDGLRDILVTLLLMFSQYEDGLQKRGLLDFDDQKLRSYLCLQASPATLRALQGRFDEVVVDEFQDINLLDFSLIQAISARASLVVTGDDDQAIYGFRGSSPRFIIELERHTDRSVTPFELSVNYRCPPNIVAHADRLIRHNAYRIPKNPIAKRTDPSDIVVASTASAGLEAKAIFDYLEQVRLRPPHPGFGDFAVLYRTNAQSLPLQVELLLRGIPYLVREEDNILTNDLLLRLLGILRCRAALLGGRRPEPADEVLVIEAYFRRVRKAQVDELRRVLLPAHDFMSFLESEEFAEILPQAGNARIAQAVTLLLYAPNLMAIISVVADRFHGMKGMVGSLEDAILDRVPLGEVTELAAEFGDDADAFVEAMERALEVARRSDAGHSPDGVSLLTYFKAKGRQWHTVILTTCNEGLIPHSRGDLEEERRLFYVALTRASSNLLISYVSRAVGAGVRPSRFLSEAGLRDPPAHDAPDAEVEDEEDEEDQEDQEDEVRPTGASPVTHETSPKEPSIAPYEPVPPIARVKGGQGGAPPGGSKEVSQTPADRPVVFPTQALDRVPVDCEWQDRDGFRWLIVRDGHGPRATLLVARPDGAGWMRLSEPPPGGNDREPVRRARSELLERLSRAVSMPSGLDVAFYKAVVTARDLVLS